ncbi:Rrp15p domain containing protein [Asbolus verrucosus]|uniref:RRP15-like protein n=1 Tax=Asbolus verrucosus TaxID=1661398 RepID=A0A482VDD8_ASBVE|nr:Rrp15p domain containing protein [Asbolus verrucosus]
MTIIAKVIETNDSEENPGSSDSESEQEMNACEDDAEKLNMNTGWADSVAKILKINKPKGKKTVVLSKAKKLTDVKWQKSKLVTFQIATADGEVKEEKIELEDKKTEERPSKKRKREFPNFRVKPNILEKERERTLAKIATRGVVQLFNAVRMQQKDISKKLQEAGPLEVRKEKVLKSIDKRAFLDVLMGEKSQIVDDNLGENKKQKSQENTVKDQTWSVLHDDFMMGAKLKDWDKEFETEIEPEQDIEIESE